MKSSANNPYKPKKKKKFSVDIKNMGVNIDKNEYYVPYSYAVGDMVVEEGNDPYIMLDSKKTLFPSNGNRLPNYLTKDGQRVIINFTFLEELDWMGHRCVRKW